MSKSKRSVALIVEDDELQAKVLQAVLKKFEIECQMVSTAHDFIEQIKPIQPDFCLIDLNIESLGVGFSVIQAVRNVLGDKPVLIVVSANSERSAITHALEIGANDYIVKPIDRDVLISKVSRYVQNDKILEARNPLLPIPEAGVNATLSIDLKIQSVDEIGINFQGKHLMSKGSVFHIGGEVLNEISGRDKPCLMTVISTWVNPDSSYGAFGEFDHTDDELMSAVRRWLASQAGLAKPQA